jgi:hypothetical protein
LTVWNRERAAAWWQDVMGFTVVSSWRGDSFDGITLMHPSGLVVSVMTHDDRGAVHSTNGASALITLHSRLRIETNCNDGRRI